MEKKIEDYLHLYLGCQVKMMGESESVFTLKSVSKGEVPFNWVDVTDENGEEISGADSDCFPLLRPLSSMTEEEKVWIEKETLGFDDLEGDDQCFLSAKVTKYLLSRSFDMFDLIPAGLAIDSTKQL